MTEQPHWFVYIVLCSDGSLYTGITTNVARRLEEHQGKCGKSLGAKYFRARQALEVVYVEAQPNRAEASKREWAVKKMSASKKHNLIATSAWKFKEKSD